ncbi:bifunctional demethylmenaquinone methyltransferase/2-methoxy-6-polyprenyl-1,4-benzoquinol methylase UbiE [Planctomycetaceae bacterium SH139]
MNTAADATDHPDTGRLAGSANPSRTLDKSNHRVREMFGQIASRYDLMNHVLSLNIDKRWRRKTVKQLRLKPDGPILDVCTGTGDLAFELSRAAGPAVAVVGSDFCHPMLQVAVKKNRALKAAESSAGDVTFLEADSQALPFPDDTFQCVTVAFGLRNIADTDQGLDEMRRVCRPGGQIAVLEFSRSNTIGLKQAYEFYFKVLLPRVGQRMAKNDKSAYHYLPQSVAEFPCGQALASRMESRGIRNVKLVPMTFGVATLYLGEK